MKPVLVAEDMIKKNTGYTEIRSIFFSYPGGFVVNKDVSKKSGISIIAVFIMS